MEREQVRMTHAQIGTYDKAFEFAQNYMPGTEPGRPQWVDIERVQATDMPELVTIRFPNRCLIFDEEHEMIRSVIGNFAIMIDAEGNIVAARHSAAGWLFPRRDERVREAEIEIP